MARTLENIVDFIRYVARKERGVFITIEEATANLDTGQMDAFEEYFKLWGINQVIHDALRPFRIYYPFTSDSSGFVTFPEDMVHLIGSPFTVTGSTVNEVAFVNESELPFALKSQLRPVTNSYPIAIDTSTGFSIYPQSTQIGFFNYLNRPNAPVYATVQNGRFIAFDATNSVELQWDDAYLNNIIAKSLRYIGINMAEQDISQFANEYDAQTK
jgi:hypothetical protein